MLKKILIPIAFVATIFMFAIQAFALNCSTCQLGSCFCNVTECSTGSLEVYSSNCTGIPIKEFIFSNSSFNWTSAKALNYNFLVYCDSGTKSNCTNVNLTAYAANVTTTTTSTTIHTTSSTTTAASLKDTCPYDCCVGDPNYFNKYCSEGSDCVNNQCVSSSTTAQSSGIQINYSLVGLVAVAILVIVFLFYFFAMRKPKDSWGELYKKYGRQW